MTFECFYCGVLYSRHDAVDANVPEEYSGTYCSEVCMTIDQAQIKQDVLAECKEEVLSASGEASIASMRTIAGFNLRIAQNKK